MANSRMEYPDLSNPLSEEGDYPDLSKPITETNKKSIIGQLPWFVRKAIEFGMASQKPLKQAVPERLAAAGAGFTHLGQGAKQLGLEAGEGLGIVNPGTATEYTKQTDLERKNYENSAAAHDPINKMITGQIEDLPYMAALGPIGSKWGLLKKMLVGSAAGGAAGATQYVPGGEDRGSNIAMGTAAGAGIPLVLKIPGMANAIVKKFGKAFQDMAPLEQKAAQAFAEQELAKSQEAQAKGFAGFETGAESEEAAQKKAQQKRAELAEMQPPEENTLPIQSSRESGDNLQRSQIAHENATNNVAQAEQQISQHLNKGAAHDVRVAADVDKVLTAEKKEIQDKFNAVERSLADKKVTIENPREAHEIMDELREYFKKANPEELAALKGSPITELMLHKDAKNISALDFMKSIRSIRGHSSDARKLAYSRGLNQADREAAMARYDYLDEVADKMSHILEKGIGKEDSALLKEASTAWRERVVPLYKNRLYQNIHYDQKMPSNIINSLRGNNKGNLIIKEAIKANPETLRNVVGQRFAHKPHELQSAGELAQEYIGQMPELQQMVEQHQGAQRAVERSKQALGKAEKTHAEITKQEVDAHRQLEKQHKEIIEHAEKKKKLQSEINNLDKHIPLLKKAAQRKDVTLKEHVRAQKEYDEAREAKKKAVMSLWKYAGTGAGIIAGSMGLKAIRGAGQEIGED